MVRSPHGENIFFEIVAGVLQGYTLAPYLFIICLDYVLRTSIYLMKRKEIHAERKDKKQMISLWNYEKRKLCWWSNASLNITAQVEFLNSLKRAARGIGHYVSPNKAEFMCPKQVAVISTLSANSRPVHIHWQ